MILDFCMTAMPRPQIVERTLRSFTKNLRNVNFKQSTLHINVDPFPDGQYNELRHKIYKICEEYFGNVKHRMPSQASYSGAYKWLWKQPDTEFFFNLEDDWELPKIVDAKLLIDHGFKNDSTQAVPLRAYGYPYTTIPTSPSIYRASFFKKVSEAMNVFSNPETQLHDYINDHYKEYDDKRSRIVNAYPFNSREIIVKDIGRAWMDKSRFKRPQMLSKDDPRYLKKNNFTKWITLDN